jgi:hypothetical protein
MIHSMTLGLVLGALALSQWGCGPKIIHIQPIKAAQTVKAGPPQSKEERAGTVPPLRGIVQRRALVPESLVPPEPPADPSPTFDVQ